MKTARIVLMVAWLLVSRAAPLASGLVSAQTTAAQPASQPSTAPAPTPLAPPSAAPKPCPATPPAASQPDCTLAGGTKKHKSTQPAAAVPVSGRSPKVVYNGNTTEPSTEISPDVSPQQASQKRGRTTWLLGKTDENLKTLAGRQLNAAQQDTVDQVKRYVEEAQAATKAGNLERAYTLANKARMLSGDMVKH